jgi:hypothetical protein
MFPEKKRHWITGPYHRFTYDSWNQWIENRAYTNSSWNGYCILLWNIQDGDALAMIQILYANPDGVLGVGMKCAEIIVSPSDEDAIRAWLSEQPHC